MQEIDGLIKFTTLLHKFQAVERVIRVQNSDRFENDVEHSYHLAMLGWYAVSAYKLSLDIDKVILYGLVHDLVEVYAGDVDAFDPDPAVHEKKAEREHKALLQIEEEFPEFPELAESIKAYEQQNDEESKFVYALDKLAAPLNIYLDDGRTWNEKGITFDQLVGNKASKVSAHADVAKYWDQFVALLEKHRKLLFEKDIEL